MRAIFDIESVTESEKRGWERPEQLPDPSEQVYIPRILLFCRSILL